jgi:hypothetical protein
MNNTILAVGAALLILVVVVIAGVIAKRRPHSLNPEYFNNRWKHLQGLCKDKNTWPLAIIDADKLLDDALKRLRYKGNTMGERLVAAQHELTDNDAVWYAHKLRNKLVHEEVASLKEGAVKDALKGFRQALKDLGAL